MVGKLKIEAFIEESLVAHVYSKDGILVAERYDTIYWARDRFLNVKCKETFDCYVSAKVFCAFAEILIEVSVVGKALRLTLFNGANYDLDMVDGNLPTFEISKLANKSAFAFGGVEKAVSKSPVQKDLNTVYVDSVGAVASDSLMAGVCNTKFKSSVAFAVPEGLHTMLNGQEAEWEVKDGKLFVKFGTSELVAILPALPEFAWWDASRRAFPADLNFVEVLGLKSSVTRLTNFGNVLSTKGGKLMVSEEHWEPLAIDGNGEMFDVANLSPILVDDKVGLALFGGNLYMKTVDAMFVCCAIDIAKAETEPENVGAETENAESGVASEDVSEEGTQAVSEAETEAVDEVDSVDGEGAVDYISG